LAVLAPTELQVVDFEIIRPVHLPDTFWYPRGIALGFSVCHSQIRATWKSDIPRDSPQIDKNMTPTVFAFRDLARGCAAIAAICVFLSAIPGVSAKDQKNDRVIRWNEANPECTVIAADGMHRYSIEYETLKLTLAVDDNELKKSTRTAEHVFSVLVTANNRGKAPIKIVPPNMKLELVSHHRALMRAQYPDELSHSLQDDSDELIYQSEKRLKKHPEEKDTVEYRLKAHEELVARWQSFLSTQALRETNVDSGRPEVTGWVFFKTNTKWLGNWKDEEEFVLRMPVEKRVFEFPFKLPQGSRPLLRQRDQP
jgi:hypothetical protein